MKAFSLKGPKGEIIKIFQEDCLQGLRDKVKDNSIDLVVTSPPYNIGVSYSTYHDKKPREEYLSWIEEVAKQIKRVLKDEGSFFLNIGGKPSDPYIPFDIMNKIRNHFALQNVIH